MNGKLDLDFYRRSDVVLLARELIGKVLCTGWDGSVTRGVITETEAYNGVVDRGSHAFNGRRTSRTEVMYRDGGCAYVYLCYGVHSLFNVVTGLKGEPHAVLIRGLRIIDGHARVSMRMGREWRSGKDTDGPGKVSKALGIHYSHSGWSLLGDQIWIEDHGHDVKEECLQVTPRIGIDYAGEDALLPYRFVWAGHAGAKG